MGRPRKLLAVDRMPLIGGAPCLDLVNTTGARTSAAPRERLERFADLVVWSQRAGLLDRPAAAALRRWGTAQRGTAERLVRRVRRLREDCYAVLVAVAEGRRPTDAALERLNRWFDKSGRRKLVWCGARLELRWRATRPVDQLMAPLVTSALDLLASERAALLKRCRECDWLFLDTSKNGSRTWCKSQCGNRARARRHYHAR